MRVDPFTVQTDLSGRYSISLRFIPCLITQRSRVQMKNDRGRSAVDPPETDWSPASFRTARQLGGSRIRITDSWESPECFTAWIPLHDCPADVGPLRILEASRRFGVQNHVDENLHVPESPERCRCRRRGGVGRDIHAGDVWLIFHSLTVHCSISKRCQTSFDFRSNCRFQDYSRALNQRTWHFAGGSGSPGERPIPYRLAVR